MRARTVRGIIAKDWKALGLKAPCNGGDNAVHASASPFEGLAERTNWLAAPIADDPFGKALLAAGVSPDFVSAGTVDPQVVLPGEGGKKGSLFDQLEDLDFDECLAKMKEIGAAN